MEFKMFPHMSGIWEGTYKRYDQNGKELFQHKSRLVLHLDGNAWRQINIYHFPNGREEFHNFGVSYFNEKGVMQYDNPRIKGEAWEDSNGKNILLWWTYIQEPGSMLHEMITPIEPGHRTRVWQHLRNGVFEGVTIIEEWKKADQETIDLGMYDQKSYIKEAEA
jgi:hypothetical protein